MQKFETVNKKRPGITEPPVTDPDLLQQKAALDGLSNEDLTVQAAGCRARGLEVPH